MLGHLFDFTNCLARNYISMKVSFETRLEAIDWIAQNVADEKSFESLREQLNYNFIYNGEFYVNFDDDNPEVNLSDELWDN